jgi:predicted nucleic acid-binding protein
VSVVVDASIAVKWVIAEEGHQESLLLSRSQPLIAPDFVLVESANVLWKKVRIGQLTREQAMQGLDFIREAYAELVPSSELVDRALNIALQLDHPVYDCLYLACAQMEQLELMTADVRFAAKLRDVAGHRVSVLPIATDRP